jgi:sugar phosphate isomerase/epimerase
MSHYSGNIDDFGMDTISLAGPLEAKLKAVREAGFTQIMLAAKDLVGHPDGMEAAVAAVRASGLRVTGFQVLRDFEGLSGHLHDYKMDIAKSMLEMCHALDCRLLLVCSSTSVHATGETSTHGEGPAQAGHAGHPDEHQDRLRSPVLGPHHQRIHHQAWDVSAAPTCPTWAWALTRSTCSPPSTPLDELDILDPDKIFLVQLADFMWTGDQVGRGAHRHRPAFPRVPRRGRAQRGACDAGARLHGLGYRGDYSFEVFNDDYQQMPLPSVAQRAWRSALWLGEDVLRRSVPLPNQMRLKR